MVSGATILNARVNICHLSQEAKTPNSVLLNCKGGKSVIETL